MTESSFFALFKAKNVSSAFGQDGVTGTGFTLSPATTEKLGKMCKNSGFLAVQDSGPWGGETNEWNPVNCFSSLPGVPRPQCAEQKPRQSLLVSPEWKRWSSESREATVAGGESCLRESAQGAPGLFCWVMVSTGLWGPTHPAPRLGKHPLREAESSQRAGDNLWETGPWPENSVGCGLGRRANSALQAALVPT